MKGPHRSRPRRQTLAPVLRASANVRAKSRDDDAPHHDLSNAEASVDVGGAVVLRTTSRGRTVTSLGLRPGCSSRLTTVFTAMFASLGMFCRTDVRSIPEGQADEEVVVADHR